MGLFDIFRQQADPAAQLTAELLLSVYPGGRQEMEAKGKVACRLCTGKLNLTDAGIVCFHAKLQFKIAHSKFDGINHFGPNAEKLMEAVWIASKKTVSVEEAASILHYAIFDKVDTSKNTFTVIHNFLTGAYGSDGVGCATDEIPGAAGEFGFEPTNPIPVRGAASNKLYLERLRTADGKATQHRRIQSLVVPGLNGRVDHYEITQNEKTVCALFLHPYNRRVSQRPPSGFLLAHSD